MGHSVEPDPLEKYTRLVCDDGPGDVKILVDTIACRDDSEGKAMYTIKNLKSPTVIAVDDSNGTIIYTNFPDPKMNIDGVLFMQPNHPQKDLPLVGIKRESAQEKGTTRQRNFYRAGKLMTLMCTSNHLPQNPKTPYSRHISNFK